MDVGGRLRAIRESKGLSQRDLGARAGLTSAAISLIEQNKSSPSVASLKSLLDAIPMTMSEFFSAVEEEGEPKYFYTGDEFIELSPQDLGLGEGAAQLSLRQVGDASKHSLQMLFETYPPGADTGPDLLKHDGEEAGVVIEGIVEVTVGNSIRVLNPGDGYLFDSRLPHRFRNVGEKRCVVVSACTPPSF
ncbi:cupin domain-containing protein [Mameliella sediminis]|uniref:cupin domain-containing protein n=1 Tax=Mameliella sediminis TaxID=2836866 RepID=UPI001C4461B9|nr:cupin domain-containing protein [Mameliella sediminis]MBV7396403.1 cupin domain-containing protein [Mameliella sediminis]MBY6162729.1 cupin domain-containing protein [Mameliella alba]MBY6170992.1 cupin domain-containing protein [Mameliella alba]MBY6176216.1 cupin domain-containing protein [Mameliella alba]